MPIPRQTLRRGKQGQTPLLTEKKVAAGAEPKANPGKGVKEEGIGKGGRAENPRHW